MKRMLFYTYWNFEGEESNGICKKIRSQKKVFEENGYQVDFTYLIGEDFYINDGTRDILLQKKSKIWTKPCAENKLRKYAQNRKYDCAYMRYQCSDYQFINLLRELKKQGTKIIIEMPTFPYDKEYSNGLSNKIYLGIDKLHRGSLKKYTYRIVTFHHFEEIYGIPAIKTVNGIEVNAVKKKEKFSDSQDIHLICVAMYSLWHALERVLNGLCTYYAENPKTKVYLHVVGDGPAIESYHRIVDNGNIGKYVIFHGLACGKELDEIYEQSDIAIETLGGHRINLAVGSTMKSREYLSRGLPYVSEMKTDILPEDWKYLIRIPYDESDVDIKTIVDFYRQNMNTAEAKARIADEIRNYAVDKIDMKATLQDVLNAFEN